MSLSYTGQDGTRALVRRMERTIQYLLRWGDNHGGPLRGNTPILYVGGTLVAAERWLNRDPAKNHTANVEAHTSTERR